jgi:hypothetical protein
MARASVVVLGNEVVEGGEGQELNIGSDLG